VKQDKISIVGRKAVIVFAGAALCMFALIPAGARAAAPPPLLAQFGTCHELECAPAGLTRVPRGVAVNPTTGDVYVADQGNNRGDEFSPWGVFIRAWGWGVRDGAAELQTCTGESGCQDGLEGSGPGEFDLDGEGIALDSAGDVFVVDNSDHRVQKFDSEGHFLLMFGGGVDQGPHNPGDVCTAAFIAEGDTCGAGSTGTADGQFGGAGQENEFPLGSYIAVGPGEEVYVGDHERIQVFGTDGAFLESLPLPGKTVMALAVAPSGDIYVSFLDEKGIQRPIPGVVELSHAGATLATLAVEEPWALATDQAGNLYVIDGEEELREDKSTGSAREYQLEVRKFTPAGVEVPNFTFIDSLVHSTGITTSSACGIEGDDLFISNIESAYHRIGHFLRLYGPPPNPSVCPPPKVPPAIVAQYATSVDDSAATLKAEINPRFWPDTTYYVQYGTGRCSEGGCEDEQPVAPGARLTTATTNQNIATSDVFLNDLAPGTVYHYRFVAASSGGGPVRGAGGEVGRDSTEGTFTTFPVLAGAKADCSNHAFRLGASALLPDCRAYEMVSPLEKNGADIEAPEAVTGSGYHGQYYPARIDQATPGGEGVTYSTVRAFGGAESAPWSSQYISKRNTAGGWETEVINPLLSNISIYGSRSQEIPFMAFSEDLCSAWLQQQTSLTLTPGAPEGVPNLYRRTNCAGGGYELLTTAPPAHISHYSGSGEEYLPKVQGSTAGGAHSVIRANGALTPEAASGYGQQLYETSEGGGLRLVSVLPNGSAATTQSSLGTGGAGKGDFHNDSVTGAISEDGSRVFWTSAAGAGEHFQPGTVYMRAHPLAEQSESGKCDEAGRACTLAISAPNSEFWAAAPNGSRVIYQTGERLFEASIEETAEKLTSKSTEIANGVDGVVGQGKDTNRIYLISSDVLSPGETSSQGTEAIAGKPNLYLYEAEGARRFTFIATVGSGESSGFNGEYSIDNFFSSLRQARVSESGEEAVFISRASLTGYDNTDVNSGEPDAEVFLYDTSTDRLDCVSCNPTGARPAGQEVGQVNERHYWAAAEIPGWEYTQYPPRVLSADGDRLFFESYDALLPSDTNGVRDVYEWERASDQEACDQVGATLYVEAAGGCLSLISSGESAQPSEFIDASSDGSNVFFTTNQSLVPQDTGLVDLYDARINGGFATQAQASVCEGEACQGAASPPNDATPASASFSGPGDLVSTLTTAAPSKTVVTKKKTALQQKNELAKALKACRGGAKAKRKGCEAAARKRYRALSKKKRAKKSSKGGGRS
jgi:DNA-binding beta-propeller fold protein YncE